MTEVSIEVEPLHEAWLRACRVDELLSRLDPPPDSLALVQAILLRARTGTQPPDAILAGHAAGLSAPQWGASGEVVQRQIGHLVVAVATAWPSVDPKVLAQIHMTVSAAAAQVSLSAWRTQAETDDLTRLRNAYGLQADFQQATLRGDAMRIGYIDLNGLKAINTAQGHDAGDRLIRDFGERLHQVVRDAGGAAYRPHGDEFIATLPVSAGRLDDILAALVEARDFSFSWGVAEWPTDDQDMQTVVRHADKAMYAMKAEHHASLADGAEDRGRVGPDDQPR